jgi:hypothetical protein
LIIRHHSGQPRESAKGQISLRLKRGDPESRNQDF